MALPGIPKDIALFTGPQLFGHLFNYALFGVLSTQVYIYNISGNKDNFKIKAFIYGLYVVEIVQLILASHDAVEVLAIGWGDLTALSSPQWLWLEAPIFSGFVSAAVQNFYAWRIHVLSKSIALRIFIGLISLMQCSAALALGIMARVANDDTVLQQKTKKPLIVWLAGSVACDCIIAGCMLYYLWRGRQRAISDKLITRLMRLTVETGSLTASVATLDLILFLTFEHNYLHMTPAIMLSKMYSNALMMVINNRSRMNSLRAGGVHHIHHGNDRMWASPSITHIESGVEAARSDAPSGGTISLVKLSGGGGGGGGGGSAISNECDQQSDIQKFGAHGEIV